MKLKFSFFFILIVVFFVLSFNMKSDEIKIELNQISHNRNVPNKILKLFDLSQLSTINVTDENKKFKNLFYNDVKGSSEMSLKEVLIKTGFTELNNLKFKISLIDVNQNENFNDIGQDMLILSRINEDSIATHKTRISNTVLQKLPFQFKVDNTIFRITSIDPKGNYLKFKPFSSNNFSAKLITKITNQSFKSPKGIETNLQSFLNLKKKVYINFINTKCEPCVKEIPKLNQFIEKHEGNIIFINLFDYKNSNEEIIEVIEKNNLKGISLVSTLIFSKEMEFSTLPNGVLLDSDGTILKDFLGLKRLSFNE